MTMTLSNMQQQIINFPLEDQITFMVYLANIIKQKSDQAISNQKPFRRKLGGLEDGFWMADDFDETPECFKEYM